VRDVFGHPVFFPNTSTSSSSLLRLGLIINFVAIILIVMYKKIYGFHGRKFTFEPYLEECL